MVSFFSILLIILAIYYAFVWSNRARSSTSKKSVRRAGGYSKWIGGGLGWAFGGPIGAILGFAFGKMYDDQRQQPSIDTISTLQGDFMASLLILTAALMKSDGKVKRSELDYVKQFLRQNFGNETAQEYLLMLREFLKQDIHIQQVAMQIGRFMDYPARLQLIHYLFGLAAADTYLSPQEIDLISRIAAYCGVAPGDLNSIKAMFVKETDSAYKILEISSDAEIADIKKAYREMAMKYHPDKVSHLGEDISLAAEKKFQTVTEAYETIKKERGFN